MHTDRPVTDQNEFTTAITAGDYPVIENNGRYEIPSDIPRGHMIRVKGTAKPILVASDSSSPHVVASDSSSPHVEASDSSSPHVVASDSSSPHVVASDSSSPHVVAYDSSSPHVVAYDSSSPHVEAYDSSSPHVVASDSSSPHVVAYDSSSPHVVAYDSSSPHVEAYDSSSPHVEAYDSSSPHVVAYDSSSPHVVAYDSSSPHVEAYDSSSPHVEAYGYASVLHVGRGTLAATEHVTVRTSGDVTVTGGALTQRVPLTTNPQLVRGALTRVETHLEEWDQGNWSAETECGTKGCYAMHVLLEVGACVDARDGTVQVASLPEKYRSRFVREHVAISLGAKVVLEVGDATAERLFHGSNSLEGLRELVDEVCAGAEPQAPESVSAE